MKTSINGTLVVRPYKNEGVKTEDRRGISFVKHAVSLIKLELLIDYKDAQRNYKAGSFVYFKEIYDAQGFGKRRGRRPGSLPARRVRVSRLYRLGPVTQNTVVLVIDKTGINAYNHL